MSIFKVSAKYFYLIVEVLFLMLIIPFAVFSRIIKKKIDVGIGPLPLISHPYHKMVFDVLGYKSETFVYETWHISDDFDVRGDQFYTNKVPFLGVNITLYILCLQCLLKYKVLVIYFNGGPLGITSSILLWRIEPLIYDLAGIKTVILPYGSDVQAMSRSNNLLFKNAMSKDYPRHSDKHSLIEKKIDLWTKYANHIVGGCEWVDYIIHWDSLMMTHFAIDTDKWSNKITKETDTNKPFTIFHAPNHKTIKGSDFIIEAVEELKKEGINIKLALAEKLPNEKIRELIDESDVVVDQLVVGWYAMFAMEAMCLEKPVICYLREDLIELYQAAGLINHKDDIPIINSNIFDIKKTLKELYFSRGKLKKIGLDSREFVIKHHSIGSIAEKFSPIFRPLLEPES